jgi:uncharacterized membrane protein HdeD (DUF308 family)
MKFKTIDLIGQSLLYIAVLAGAGYEYYQITQSSYNSSLPGFGTLLLFLFVGSIQLISGFWYLIEKFYKFENKQKQHIIYTIICIALLVFFYVGAPFLESKFYDFFLKFYFNSPIDFFGKVLFSLGGFLSLPIYITCIVRYIHRNS